MFIAFSTQLSDGTHIKTGNSQGVLGRMPRHPQILGSMHPHTTPVLEQWERHKHDVAAHLSTCGNVRINRLETAADVLAFAQREHQLGAQRRRAFGWNRKSDVVRLQARPVSGAALLIANAAEKLNKKELLSRTGEEKQAAQALLADRNRRAIQSIKLAMRNMEEFRRALYPLIRHAKGMDFSQKKLYALVAGAAELRVNDTGVMELIIFTRKEGGPLETYLTFYAWDAEALAWPGRILAHVLATDAANNVYIRLEFNSDPHTWLPGQRPTDDPPPYYADFEGSGRAGRMPELPGPPYRISFEIDWERPVPVLESSPTDPNSRALFNPRKVWR
jgi:hypothetical protein